MSLQLILGRAGTGKTTWLHDKLKSLVQAGQRELILLVPEQDSFTHERALLKLLGEQQALAVEVLSFTRLADSLFRACGGQGGRVNLSDAQRAIAMSLALDAVRDKLDLFAKAGERMIPGLLRLHNELSLSGTSPVDFGVASRQLGQAKLVELAQIMQAYDAILEDQFGGHCNNMRRLYESLGTAQGRAFLAGKIVAIDSFMGFTPQELKILGRVLEHSDAVFVTLCLDKLQHDETGVFAHTSRTAASLNTLAKQANVARKTPVILTQQHRFQHEDLHQLEAAFFAPQAEGHPASANPAEIALCVCEDIEAECTLVATRIKALLRHGTRCRDIAVIARDSTAYEQPLYAAFRRVGVPLFEDRRQPVAAQPLMRMVAAALDIAEHGFTLDAVMRWLKTGLTQLNDEEIASVEDYALLWRINGKQWLQDWTSHPRGLGQPEDAYSDLQLSKLNDLRIKITAPLIHFRAAMHHCTGHSGAAALDELLQNTHVPVGLKKLRAELDPAQALELIRIWELLMALLDMMAQGLGAQVVGAPRFCALFNLVISLQTLGQLPQSLDTVAFGAAERVRLQSPKAVFVLGLNDGVFPQLPPQNSLISDRERVLLAEAGLAMQDTAPLQLAMERMIVYRTLTAAREQLHLSWALRTASGDELRPSSVIHWLCAQFPGLKVEDAAFLDPLDKLEGESAAFALLCEEQAKQSPLYAALHSYFQQKPALAGRLTALERTANEQPDTLRMHEPETARALFRNAAYLSPSRVERYARCAFQYYCNHGLKARARRAVDFDPLLRGDILHWLFEQIFTQHSVDQLLALDDNDRCALVNELFDDYAGEHFPAQLPARVTYLFNRLRDIAVQVLARMIADFQSSQFRPAACELRIDMDQPVKPYPIALPNGNTLRLGGKVDRVDCAEHDGKRYFRVVDYKTGGRDFNLGHVFEGLDLQMIVYLLALQSNHFEHAQPAGVVYSQARDPVLSTAERSRSLQAEKRKSTRAKGFVLEDAQQLCATSPDDVITAEALGKLRREVDGVLANMAQNLLNGNIAALPTEGSCDYCEFQAICGREATGAQKELPKMNFSKALELLDERHPDDD